MSRRKDTSIYVSVDHGFPNSAKVKSIPKRHRAHAMWAWLQFVCYCSQNLSDGFVDQEQLQCTCTALVLQHLCTAGLMDRAEGGAFVHDYLDWNRSREEITSIRAKKVEAGRKGGQAKAVADATARAIGSARGVPWPETETDTDTSKDSAKRAGNEYDQDFLDWWTGYPRKREKARAAKSYKRARKSFTAEELVAVRDSYADANHGNEERYLKLPATFLNQIEDMVEDYPPESPPPEGAIWNE